MGALSGQFQVSMVAHLVKPLQGLHTEEDTPAIATCNSRQYTKPKIHNGHLAIYKLE